MRLSTDTMAAMLREPPDGDTPGGRLWHARDAAHLGLDDLARHLGVDREAVSDWERDRSAPHPRHLLVMAGLLGVSPEWLTTGLGKPPQDGPGASRVDALYEQLAALRMQHAETSKAICALELTLQGVLQDG